MGTVKVTRIGGLVVRTFYNDIGITTCCFGDARRLFYPDGSMKIFCSQCGRELPLLEHYMLQIEVEEER